MNFTNHCNQYYPVSRDIIIRQDCVWKCHLALKSPAFNGSGQGLHTYSDEFTACVGSFDVIILVGLNTCHTFVIRSHHTAYSEVNKIPP